jgi:hypothetical protein
MYNQAPRVTRGMTYGPSLPISFPTPHAPDDLSRIPPPFPLPGMTKMSFRDYLPLDPQLRGPYPQGRPSPPAALRGWASIRRLTQCAFELTNEITRRTSNRPIRSDGGLVHIARLVLEHGLHLLGQLHLPTGGGG